MAGSFVNNINYVASLDTQYGNGLRLYKSNVALGEVAYTVSTSITVYNDTTLLDEVTNVLTSSAVTVTTLVTYVADLKVALEGLGYTVPVATVVDGIGTQKIVTVEVTGSLLMSLNMVITVGALNKYSIISELVNPTKILPLLATMGSEFVAGVKVVKDNVTSINTVATNINAGTSIDTVAGGITDGSVSLIANNMASVIKNANVQDMTVTLLPDDTFSAASYDSNSNIMSLNIKKGDTGENGVSPEYVFTYDAASGMLQSELIGYAPITAPSIKEV
jgi:hypothetical protein